jgi:hypothetical protein
MLHKVERNPTHSGHGQRAVNGACPPVIPKRGRNGSGLFISLARHVRIILIRKDSGIKRSFGEVRRCGVAASVVRREG